jgi:hypothetical protein
VEIRVGFGACRLPFRGIVAKVEVFDDLLVRFSVSQKRRRLDKVVATCVPKTLAAVGCIEHVEAAMIFVTQLLSQNLGAAPSPVFRP